ncbi:MAG: hypothetical protein KIT70_03090 [Anaerolineales bacterium]|nr:MAG: hypothetical protein KIT70_03090 [Anaerolineales bacterium]
MHDFTISDYGALNTARHHALFLHNQSVLTRGPAALTRRALLAPLCSLTGVHTAVSAEDGLVLQAQRFAGRSLAALVFLAPQAAANGAALTRAVEYMLKQLGTHGVQGLFAELDEHSAANAALQQAGLSVQTHQRVWRLTRTPHAGYDNLLWQPHLGRHALAVSLLRNSLIPVQLQHLDCGSADLRDSFVVYEGGQLAAFADVQRGPKGIWVQLLIEPGHALADRLMALMLRLRPRPGRPVYVNVRAHQDWLEPALEGLDAQPGPRQVVLVRRMVQPVKVKDLQKIAKAAGVEASTIQFPVRPRATMDEK